MFQNRPNWQSRQAFCRVLAAFRGVHVQAGCQGNHINWQYVFPTWHFLTLTPIVEHLNPCHASQHTEYTIHRMTHSHQPLYRVCVVFIVYYISTKDMFVCLFIMGDNGDGKFILKPINYRYQKMAIFCHFNVLGAEQINLLSLGN